MSIQKELIADMQSILKHRGPDGSGTFMDDTFAFGHRRLAIIDLESGSQPMANEDGSIITIFNGEIYNYKELREVLIRKGHQFRTQSDTEVIVHLYEEEGIAMFTQLNGMFAIAIADLNKKELILVRDRLGEKPLFYYADRDWVVFASEVKAVILHPSVQRRLNCAALYDYLSLNYIPGERTMFDGVYRIPPGESITFTEETMQRNTYWNIRSFTAETPERYKESEAVEHLESLLSDSIRLRLRSDVPIGIFLSGGIDSSLIAWKAREIGADIVGYTASFNERDFSEEAYAREVAKELGIEINVFSIEQNVEKILNALIYHADEPLADSSSLPVYLLSQHTARCVKVVLGGDGGDELFAGYLTYPATLLAKAIKRYVPSRVLRMGHNVINHLPVSERKVSLEYKMKRFMRGLTMAPGPAHFSWNGTWCGWEKNELLTPDFMEKVKNLSDTYEYLSSKYEIDRARPELVNLQIADVCEYLSNDILAKVDRMSMAHGLEVRSPFLDYRIVEWALQLPAELKLKRGIGKYLLKRAMGKRFPQHLVNRPKEGFSIPINKWIRENSGGLIEEYLSERALSETGIFNVANVRRKIALHREKKAAFGFEIWGLLIFMGWHRAFIQGQKVAGFAKAALSRI